jgi:hypothetical protein
LTTAVERVVGDGSNIVLNKNQDRFRVMGEDTVKINYSVVSAGGKLVLKGQALTNSDIRLPKMRHGVYLIEAKAKNKVWKLKTEIIHN